MVSIFQTNYPLLVNIRILVEVRGNSELIISEVNLKFPNRERGPGGRYSGIVWVRGNLLGLGSNLRNFTRH